MHRLSPEEVEITVQPANGAMNAQELELFKESFVKSYLNTDSSVTDLYKLWSERDPKYFAKIPLYGVRCLRQDPWECTLSFICSQNNNIKRITQLVRTLRNTYGKPICKTMIDNEDTMLHSFPSFEDFRTNVTEAKLRQLGFGYRAPYIEKSVKIIHQNGGEKWLNELRGK